MLKAGLKPLEPYANALSKWKCLHIKCGEIVYPQYAAIQSGRGGCRKCANEIKFAKSRLTQAEVNNRLKEKKLVAIEKYFNSSTAFKCKCLKCGNIQSIKFRNINKISGCAKCGYKIGGLKLRVSQSDAIRIMNNLDLEPLEPYVLSDKKWKCRCLKCGTVVYPTYAGATEGKRGCVKCGYKSSSAIRRTPEKDAIKILKKSGLTPLEPFKNSHTRWKSKCNTCNKTVYPSLAVVKFRKSGCRYCAPNGPVDKKEALKIMKKANLKPLEPFVNANTKWKCECLRCHRIISPKYSKIQQGQLGCKQCGYIVAANKNRIPEKLAIKIMRRAKLMPLETYRGDGVKWKCKCMKCGNIVYPMLTNIKQKNGGCVYCADKGLDFTKPAYLYLLTNSRFGAHKVGVGNFEDGKKNDRITKFRKYGWELYKRWDFENGFAAHSCEQLVLKHLRKELKLPPFMILELMKETGGHSETVEADSITLLELEKIIKRVIKAMK